MKTFVALGALSMAGILSVAPNAHADYLAWVQEPGLAIDIGVAANDMPWIVDTNGVVQYGTPTEACGSGICVATGDVTWHALAGTMWHIAVSLGNSVYATDPTRGEFWAPQLFDTAASDGDNGSNWMRDFQQWYGLTFYDYAGAPPSSTGQIAIATSAGGIPGLTITLNIFGISWSDSSVQEITPTLYECAPGGHIEFCTTNPYWTNTGGVGKEVTLFSEVSGSLLTQTPWVVTSSGGLYYFNGSWIQVEGPAWSNGATVPGGVTYATDSWVVAGNTVWAWLAGANAERRTGLSINDYDEIIGPPPSATIAKIAVAGAYPAAGWAGSRIWALDTAHRILRLGRLSWYQTQVKNG